MHPTQATAYAYRFQNAVALHTTCEVTGADSCPTVYLTAAMARTLARALVLFADSCDGEAFQDSPAPVTVHRDGSAAGLPAPAPNRDALKWYQALEDIRSWYSDEDTDAEAEEWPNNGDMVEGIAVILRGAGVWFDDAPHTYTVAEVARTIIEEGHDIHALTVDELQHALDTCGCSANTSELRAELDKLTIAECEPFNPEDRRRLRENHERNSRNFED